MATARSLGLRAVSAALFAFAPLAAHAQGWTGAQAGSYSGYNPFNIVGDVLTISAGADTFITSAGANLNNNLLLGIRGIWLVDDNGDVISGLTSPTGSGVSGLDWNVRNHGYVADNGFPPSGYWVTMQEPSVMTQYGLGSGTGYTTGTFTFAPMPSSYNIGIDYLVADKAPTSANATDGTTRTGRVYFRSGSIPEPSSIALAGVGLALSTVALRRRRR